MKRFELAIALVLGAWFVLMPLWQGTNITLLNLAFFTFIYISQAYGWNILGGYAGQVSFGYTAFFGLGAYTTGLLWLAGVPPFLTLPVGALVAVVFALIIGLPTFRLSGPYFSIATLGVGEAMRVLMLNLDSLGGASGLNLPHGPMSKLLFYYVSLALASTGFVLTAWLRGNKFGLGLRALNTDQEAAASVGVDVVRYKNYAHVLGAVIVGMAGSLYAVYFQYIQPDQVFGFSNSISMVLMSVIGGVGTLWGPAIGGTIFYYIQDALRTSFPNAYLFVYGFLLVVIILFEPQGIVGLAQRLTRLTVRLARGRAVNAEVKS